MGQLGGERRGLISYKPALLSSLPEDQVIVHPTAPGMSPPSSKDGWPASSREERVSCGVLLIVGVQTGTSLETPRAPSVGVGEPAEPRAHARPYLLLMKPNVTGSRALLDGVAQHSVRTTLRLLLCL